jgi:hypothetical protein
MSTRKEMPSNVANGSSSKRKLALKKEFISSESENSSNVIRDYESEFYDGCKKVQKGDEQSWNNLRELLNVFKNNEKMLGGAVCSQGSEATDNGWTPLHILLEKKPPADIISTLIMYSPDAIEIKNKCGELPIHTASRNTASIEVLNLLIQAYPEGLKVQSNHGFLPLHDLCFHGATYETVVLFLQAYPGSVKVKDLKDWLPIHRACWRNINLEVLNTLLEAYPQSSREKCSHGKPSTILKKYCRTLNLKDQYGRTLLHYAFNGHFSQDLISLLIDAHPKGLEITDMYGNTPAYYGNEQHLIPIEEILNSCFLQRIYCDRSIMELSITNKKASGEVTLALQTGEESKTPNLDQDTTTDVGIATDSSAVGFSAEPVLGTVATMAETTNANQETKNVHIALDSSNDFLATTETERVSPLKSLSMEETFTKSRNRHNKRLRYSLVKFRTAINSNTTNAIQMKEEIERQKSKIIYLESQAQNLLSQLLELKTKNYELQSDNTRLKSQVAELQTNYSELLSNNSHVISQVVELQNNNFELQSDNTDLISQVAELQHKHSELPSNNIHLISQVVQLQTNNSRLQSDSTYLKSQVAELQTNNSELRSKIVTLKDEVSRMNEEMNELKSDLEEFNNVLLSSLLQF